MGLTGGILNFASNIAGVLTPIVVGAIIGTTGSFFYALAYVGAAALLGLVVCVSVGGREADRTRVILTRS